MEDEHTLKGIVCEKYPDLPYFLFGHSMGSFITRDFISKYGEELTGATICGTTGIFRGAKEVGEKLKEVIDAGQWRGIQSRICRGTDGLDVRAVRRDQYRK